MILPWGEGGACDTGRIPGGHGEAFEAGTSKTAPFRMDVDGEEVKKCALRPPGLGRERKPLRGATQFQRRSSALAPSVAGRGPHPSPGPLLGPSSPTPGRGALSALGFLSVRRCCGVLMLRLCGSILSNSIPLLGKSQPKITAFWKESGSGGHHRQGRTCGPVIPGRAQFWG